MNFFIGFIVINMRCTFCLSDDPKYFKDGECRRCLALRQGRFKKIDYKIMGVDSDYHLSFELTQYQKEISRKIIEHIQKEDVVLEAVCGAGKTEMCYELIKQSLHKGLKVGWAIPRRQVVIELQERLSQNFNHLKVICVCEGYTDDLIGDLIICTTHQLFRYHKIFDVLILDEPDAFPFVNDTLLFNLMRQSVKGHVLFMSATVDDEFLNQLDTYKHLKMPLRPNLIPLPIPIVRRSYLWLLQDLKKHFNKRLLIFVPTIKMANYLSTLLHVPALTSKTEDKELILKRYLNHEFNILITTTILERGVTFLDVFVYVIQAHHPVFNEASLIQIAGRVLRGASKEGKCYFYAPVRSEAVEKCLGNLNTMNTLAYHVLNP